jgi:hypothetical protein
MCFCFPFGLSNKEKRKSSSSGEKKRWDKPHSESLRGDGRRVVTEMEEKRASMERPRSKRSRESSRREIDDSRQQHPRDSEDMYRSRPQYRTRMQLEFPGMFWTTSFCDLLPHSILTLSDMWHRPVEPAISNSSEEMLLNPRPHRSQQHRQKHPSQKTLRGHGKRVHSKRSARENSGGGWSSLFSSPPPKTPKRRDNHQYQNLDSFPRSHRSHHQHRSPNSQDSPESSHSQRHHRSRQHQSSSSTRQTTPNTSARRVPDRRFAVLAATNSALEDLRREAFSAASPPPRRDRLRRYQGVTIPAASIPYSWDCVSSSQTSNGTGHGESSTRQRRRR